MFGGDRLSRLDAFSPQFPDADRRRLSSKTQWADRQEELLKEGRTPRLEGEFIEAYSTHAALLVEHVPQTAEGFAAWFEARKDHGPDQGSPLFEGLEGSASLDDLKRSLFDAAPCGDPIIRYLIAPAGGREWLWRTTCADGRARGDGRASSRKLAAALVIRDIIRAQAKDVVPHSPLLTAKAA